MLIALMLLLALIGVVLLRLGWDARERAQVRLTLAGWLAIGAALVVLAIGDGAWGIALASLPVMLGAMLLLARAAMTSRAPARAAREPAPEPTVHFHTQSWPDVARRIGIFVLSVPVAGVVSLLAGMAAAAIGRTLGWVEADSNVLALFVTPLVWSILGVVLLMRAGLVEMIRPLAALGIVSGALVWSLG
jgi:hypothetical protein